MSPITPVSGYNVHGIGSYRKWERIHVTERTGIVERIDPLRRLIRNPKNKEEKEEEGKNSGMTVSLRQYRGVDIGKYIDIRA